MPAGGLKAVVAAGASVIVYVALATALFVKPVATAIALIVVVTLFPSTEPESPIGEV